MATVLVIAAHPDDEVLGCGATMAWHADRGDPVHVVFIADGETSRRDGAQHQVSARGASAAEAARVLGAHPPRSLGFPDQRLDAIALLDIVQAIEPIVNEIRPDIVYTHFLDDLNTDHAIVARSAMTACRPQPGGSVRALYAFEVLSATNWLDPTRQFFPQRTIDVSAYWARKQAALRAYEREMRPSPHARSHDVVDALGTYRGGLVGVAKGEAFVVLREIVN